MILAATLALAVPAPATFSTERLARIDKVFQQYVDENRIGGAVGLVLQDGKPKHLDVCTRCIRSDAITKAMKTRREVRTIPPGTTAAAG